MRRLISIGAMFCCCMFLGGCIVVDDGTVGVVKKFGKIQDEALNAGPYFWVPWAREIVPWNTKTQRRSLHLSIPSAEGLIVKLEVAVLFRPTNVVELRKKVGPEFVQVLLDSTITSTFRQVIGKQKVEDLITSQEGLTESAFTRLSKALDGRGITIEQLMIVGLELPQKFKDAIERKLEQEQKALQKHFELDQAMKDAEIEVARARGAAEAQEIVRTTLSMEYLQYLWIKTLNDNPNVIYVATEANMPMFRTSPQSQTAVK